MSKKVDERVVEMRFENGQFERNVQTSMSTIDKLKQKLNFTDSAKGLDNISAAAKRVDMNTLGSGVDSVRAKFSALQVVGVTALANITNSVVNAGKNIAKALTIDPIIDGFNEYETQLKSIQTIMANTASKGTTLDQVNAALDELNQYADKTIYNFGEMTRNIGTFTAAGVDLETSVASIKGLSNLAAASGSSATQASTAMYQLSQAIAAGKVQLMDWNSVVNAGMGGELFQNALKRTAEHFGYNVDGMIKKYGSFRESLTQGGWLTTEVLTETLTQLSGAYTEADLIAQGYTEKQAKEIVELANTAEEAATKIRSFSQLWDTLRESAGSGWAETWEILIGNFEEAGELFTGIGDTLTGAMQKISDARNNLLQGWKDLGGRTALLDSFKNIFEGIGSVVKPIGEAFREVFSPLTSQQLFKFTEGLRDFTSNLKISDETAASLKATFKGLFSIVEMVANIFTTVLGAVIPPVISILGTLGKVLVTVFGGIGNFISGLNDGIQAGNGFSSVGDAISFVLDGIANALSDVVSWFGSFGDVMSGAGDAIGKAFSGIGEAIGTIGTWLSENISIGDIFAGLAGGGLFMVLKKFAGLIGQVKDALEGLFSKKTEGIGSKFSEILDSIHGSLESFQQGIQVGALIGIAAAIMMLSSALSTISEINPGKIAYSLVAIQLMIMELNAGFSSLSKTLSKFNAKGTLRGSLSMIAIAAAINILATAMKKLADLSLGEIAKGLAGVGGLLIELSLAMKLMNDSNISLRTSVAILALAKACQMLSTSLESFSGLSWDEIARGLTAMGGALLELSLVMKTLNKVGGFGALLGGAALLIAVQSLDEISENLERLGKLSWDQIGRGLAAMGGALGELTVALGALSKIGGFGAVLGGTSILIAVQSLDEISTALESLSLLSWEEIGRGLAAMGGALGELSVATGALGKLAGFSGLLGGGSLVLAVQSLADLSEAFGSFGTMAWDEIGRGLAGMGGALAELAVVSGALGKLAGFSGLLGAGSLVLGVQSLGQLADAFGKFGSMNWDEIGRGLAGMGAALGEVALISGALGSLTNVFGLLGAGTLTLGVQGLEKLANAFQKFGSMNWDEIKRGLAAMGGAMGETALGGLLNTFSGLGSASIAIVAESLGVLADSVKKWVGVTVPENLGSQLGSLAWGIMKFTAGGFGADTISTVAAPLGVMADSIKKWTGVTVPEGLGEQIGSLASGVKAFTFGGLGSGALAEAAPAVGQMADSVAKWSGVTVPEGLGEGLTEIAKGVKEFTLAFVGGMSLDSIIDPFNRLADSMVKWSGVTIPEGIGEGLKTLADGIGEFTWSFLDANGLESVIDPFNRLGDAVRKWNGINVSSIGPQLTSLADGLKSIKDADIDSKVGENLSSFFSSFSSESVGTAISNISSAVSAINSMASINVGGVETFKSAMESLSDVSIGNLVTGLQNGLGQVSAAMTSIVTVMQTSLMTASTTISSTATSIGLSVGQNISNGLRNGMTTGLSGSLGSITAAAANIANATTSAFTSAISSSSGKITSAGKKMVDGFASGIRSSSSSLRSAASTVAKSAVTAFVTAVSGASSRSTSAGKALASGLANGIRSGSSAVTSAVNNLTNSALRTITSANSSFTNAGSTLGINISRGIDSKKSAVTSSVRSLVSGAGIALRSYYSNFYSAGAYLCQGLANGISSNSYMVRARAAAMASAAASAARAALAISSPSKVFYEIGDYAGQGFVKALTGYQSISKRAGGDMADSATTGLSVAMSKIERLLDSDMDITPTIRPVVDLTNVQNGVNSINGMFGDRTLLSAVGRVSSIDRMMNQREPSDGIGDVVDAIEKLRKKLDNVGGTSYNINGITYDDGTNISEAVQTLVRAARVERRI